MKNLARGVALSVVALIGLVPINASPAVALVGSLDVTPEKVTRLADSDHRLTATVSPASAQTIVFDEDNNPITPAPHVRPTPSRGSARSGSTRPTARTSPSA